MPCLDCYLWSVWVRKMLIKCRKRDVRSEKWEDSERKTSLSWHWWRQGSKIGERDGGRGLLIQQSEIKHEQRHNFFCFLAFHVEHDGKKEQEECKGHFIIFPVWHFSFNPQPPFAAVLSRATLCGGSLDYRGLLPRRIPCALHCSFLSGGRWIYIEIEN